MLGGRAAEELIFHELTGGASSDIDRVTSVARKMVVYLGMSDLGPIDFGPQYDTSEYGMRYYDGATLSDKMQEAVDGQVKKFIDEAKASGGDPHSIEKEVSESNAPPAVKDTLVRYLKQTFPNMGKSSLPWWKR